MSVPDGAKTTVAVALLGSDSPSGRLIHEINKESPWSDIPYTRAEMLVAATAFAAT
jgi:hypothetical protein